MADSERTLTGVINQSPPIDVDAPYDPDWVKGKTILITGGASGFGEGFFRRWASHGANVIIGDINDKRGKELVEEVRAATGNNNHHYIHCDVTNWQNQVDFFHQAIKLSPTGGIDSVVANAGISDPVNPPFWDPMGYDADQPRQPNISCLNVNLIGVTYTTSLALYYLQRNPNSHASDYRRQPRVGEVRDRHLLLLGSVASLGPIPGQILYGAAKHGVLGLFRSLRSTAFVGGLRVNLLCPYFIETPLITTGARVLLAGGAMGKPEDVVEAGTRLQADTRIIGRSLVVGPKVKFERNNQWEVVPFEKDGIERTYWEAYAEDFEVVEAFSERFVRMLNGIERVRGWTGWGFDVVKAVGFGISRALGYV